MKLFLFNNDEKLIGTVSPLEGIQNEEINKIQTIECTVVYSELIEKASYIGHKDYSDNRIFHLYKIDHVTKTSTTDVKIVGVHTFFDDMESDGYIKDFRPTNRELVGVLTTILDGSRWQLGTVNIQRRYTGNFYYVTRKEALSKLIEATQIEIKPRLEFSCGKITGRYLDVFTRLGGRNGKVFVHGRDLLTVSEKKSQGAIYTAVVGRGKGEETDTGGYGRRITFKDVEWRRTSGQPVDKPVGQEYVEIPAMTKLYGFEKGTKPRIKIVEFQDETDKEKLLRLSYEWLEKNSRMQVEYSAKVLNVGNLELGDTVGVFNPKLGIKYETRVFKVKRNLVDNKLTEFGIGDKVTTSPFNRTIELAKEMKNFQDDTVYWLDKIRERLSDKLINEDGYNYDLKADNEYKVPAGYYSFDKPIDQNPTKVVYMGAGKIAIANSKKPTGEWNWRTFLDGNGATLDLINTGVLKAGRIQSADGRSYWDLDTGEFHMEQSAINEAVKTVVNGKVQEIVGEVKKNLPTKEELKGKSSYIHKKYSDFPDGRSMSDNSTLKYIGIYTGDKEQAPTNASEYSWTKIKVDGKLYKAYSNSLNGLDFTLVEPDENAKLFAKNRPRVNIVNDNDISDIWQANMFLSFKPNTKYTLTARAKGNNNKLWAYFRNNKTNEEYNWGQLEFRGLETKSITFTTTNDVEDVLFKFVLVPEDEDWTGIQIDWFTIYEGDKRYTDYPANEPAQYHKYRYFGYVFKESTPVASDFEWFDLQQTSITNDKYTHIVYSDNADGSNFGREPKKYMGVARTTSPTQPADKTAYKWFKMKGEDGRDGVDGKSINRNYITDSKNLNTKGFYSWNKWDKLVSEDTIILTRVNGSDTVGFYFNLTDLVKTQFQNETLTWSIEIKASRNMTLRNVGFETNGLKQVTITTEWQRISHTFINKFTNVFAFVFYNPTTNFNNGDKIYIRLPKLEKGNVATEWSPAYEDLRGRDGVSNYIHRKYSDYSNGANMSDNSNLKYIGIYTGTSPTPPTTASSYLWSKIKGEDGANGVPGVKGADGRTPYFHTAYSNSATGDRDFSTTNSTGKEYIGTYSDFEVADSTDYRKYKWVKIKGEDGRNGNNGRDGVSSYIYRKYSDNANGSPMSDNSNLKYIGIYTGTSATAPTTPSAYTWSKIKGEDGQQGVPGARGSDGRTSYLHTAYANSATGDRDFSTTNSNGKEYIGTYTDFEINDSNDYRRYKWVKIKGENGLNGRDGKSINENLLPNSNFVKELENWEMPRLNNSGLNWQKGHAIINFGRGLHIWGTPNGNDKGLGSMFNFIAKQGEKITLSMDLGKDALNNYSTLFLGIHYIGEDNTIKAQEWQQLDLATIGLELKKYKRISKTFTVGSDMRKCRLMIHCKPQQLANFYIDNIKLERGEVATEWSPAYEDLQAHTLIANLRLEGRYINNITNGVKGYLDVFYDGQKITDGFNARIKFKGGILNTWSNFWDAKVDNTGLITNLSWGDKEQQYPIALDVIVLVTYKDSNTIANARMENIPDVVEIKEITKKYKTFESTIDQFNSTIGEVKQQVIANEEKRNLIIGSRLLNQSDYKEFGKLWDKVSDQGISSSIRQDLNENVPMLPNGNPYLLVVSLNNPRNSWQGVGFNLSEKELYRGRTYSLRIPILLWRGFPKDADIRVEIKNHTTNKVIWGERLDHIYMPEGIWYIKEFKFTINETVSLSDYAIWIYNVKNGAFCISSLFMCEGDTLPNNYSPAPEDFYLQNSRIESSIKQTKDEIDLKVSKDNVINAINISSEGTRITGTAIADYLYGKTIVGATLQGNTQIKLGEHGFLQPITQGLQINAPADYNANHGVGFQIRGKIENHYDGAVTPKGVFIYNDTDFSTGGTAYENVNDILLTVNGKVSMCNNFQGGVVSGAPIISNFTYNKPVTLTNGKMYRISFIGWDGKSGQLYVNDGSATNGEWWFKPDSSSSDKRLKENIKKTTHNGLDLVNKLKFYSFDWKSDKFGYKKPHTKIGQLAQDLQKLDESLVYLKGDMLAIDDFRLLNISLKAIQELSIENQQLKSQLKEMNERLQKLEDKINGNL